jgi:GH25 family lysozyme M1 (1,4-beta-N-acetylmuramidase)
MLYGIDVSYAQDIINWEAVSASGKVQFAYSRACYGSDPANDDGAIFTANHYGCKAHGIPFGAYIFFLFTEDAVAQANHFLQVINGYQGQLRPMVDVEGESGSTGSVQGNIDALAAFDNAIQSGLGCQPIIYTNPSAWNTLLGGTNGFAGHSLWVANFTGTPGQLTLPTGFSTWTLHQYSDSGSIPGINNQVDLDVLTDLTAITR